MKESVCKICRRLGEKLFLKGERCIGQKCAMIRRNYPPGMHGQKRRRASSEYGSQLKERKKAELKRQGSYLDYKVYDLKLAPSLRAAKQLISHGRILVNNKKINIASYNVKKQDTIKLIKLTK
ncbi:MAG: S4 domain-containing protein [bacterium]